MDLDVMLCDFAQVAGDKLFINGANIDRILFPADDPAPHVVNVSAAGLVGVPWAATNSDHVLAFRMLTDDGEDPLLPGESGAERMEVGGEMGFNLGRPAELAAGDSQSFPFVFAFPGLPFLELGRYVLVFSLDGVEIRRLGFTLERVR